MRFLNYKPEKYKMVFKGHQYFHEINYNIKFDENRNEFVCETVTIPGDLEYGKIVNGIISAKYPQDKMQAIINNYLIDPNEEHTKEFQDMQEWRSFAKEYAKNIKN